MNNTTPRRQRTIAASMLVIAIVPLVACSSDPPAATTSRPATETIGLDDVAAPQLDSPADTTVPPASTEAEPIPEAAPDTSDASNTTPEVSATIAAFDESFEGGAVDIPRSIRYGYLTVSVTDVRSDAETTSVSLTIENPTEADISNLRPELFRLLDTDGALVDLELPDGGNIDVDAGTASDVVLVGAAVDPERVALHIDDRRSVPAILPFGGPLLVDTLPVALTAPEIAPLELDCPGGDTIKVDAAVTATTLTLDRNGPTGILSFGIGRADADERYVHLELSLTQLDACDLTVRLSSPDVTSGDLDVDISRPDLVAGRPAAMSIWVTVPFGVAAVDIDIAGNPPLTIEIDS